MVGVPVVESRDYICVWGGGGEVVGGGGGGGEGGEIKRERIGFLWVGV